MVFRGPAQSRWGAVIIRRGYGPDALPKIEISLFFSLLCYRYSPPPCGGHGAASLAQAESRVKAKPKAGFSTGSPSYIFR